MDCVESSAPPKIHPSADVHASAQLDQNTVIGPFCVVGPEVHLGAGTCLHSHVVVAGWTTTGRRCQLFPFAVIGGPAQDRKFRGEPSRLVLGDEVVVREHATVHRGTAAGDGTTRLDDQCLLMAYSHVAHDCCVGRGVVMANGATLAGHVIVGDFAVLGGFAAVGQFLRVGESAMLAAGARVEQDVPPYCTAAGDRARVRALNIIGLRRRGFSAEQIGAISQAFRRLFRTHEPLSSAMTEVAQTVPQTPEVSLLLAFLRESRRGVSR